jgi:hypothetical protein
MQSSTGTKDDDIDGELKRLPESMRALAYLNRRDQQILQSQQAIGKIQGTIHDVMIDIARVLAAAPSAGNQAMLDRSLGDLKGLANAVAQTSAANVDGGGTKGANVDLTGINAAIEARANSPSRNGTLGGTFDKTKSSATKAKALPSLDAAPASGADPSAPRDTKAVADAPGGVKPPAADTPVSNVDRVKQALAKSGDQADPAAAAISDLPPLPDRRPSRLNAAALKLDHAEAVAKSDAPDGKSAAQIVDPTAKVASAPAKAEPVVVAAARKPPGPAVI